jgi:tRNA(fMet)-specific endonuclease VapC
MYLLDADTVIYSLKGHLPVQQNLSAHINDSIKLCAVTLMELYYGAYKSRDTAGNIARIRALEASMEILALGNETAEVFGLIKARLEKTGNPLDDFDLLLASCAITHNLTLVTNNMKHFKRIQGLKLTNWTVYPEE